MSSNIATELLPCPFCQIAVVGKYHELIEHPDVEDKPCPLNGGVFFGFNRWNQRAAPSVVEPKEEPASGKFKMSIFEELLDAAQDAADFMSTSKIGSQEYEMSIRLQLAIERAAK